MKNFYIILDNLIGPQIGENPLSRFEAMQPTPDTYGNLDLDRFIAVR